MAHPHFKGNLIEAVNAHLNGLGNLDFAVGWEMASHETVKHLQLSGLNSMPVPLSLKNVKGMFSFKCQELEQYKALGQAKQIPADKVIQDEDEKVSPFFKGTVQELPAKALAMLGLNQAAINVEPELHSVLIQGLGGVLSTEWKAPENPKTFGVMLVQVPVEGGHEGGDIKVNHADTVKQFDTWQSSSELCHVTAFYSDCAHKLENVTFGWRVTLVFHLNLTSCTSPGGLSPTPSSPTFVTISNVRDVLKQWSNQLNSLLALPLEHRYADPPRFAYLKGRDRVLAQLLLSVDSEIDLHLVQLTKEEEGNIFKEPDEEEMDQDQIECQKFLKSWCECCAKKRCKCFRRRLDRVKLDDDAIENYDVNCWINVNDQPVQMVPKLNLRLDYDLLYGSKKSLFPPEMVPDKKDVTFSNPSDALAEDEDDMMSENEAESLQILLQFYYHRNTLVIWPKRRSLYYTLKYNFPAILDRLDEPNMLTRALTYCEEQPISVWKRNDNGATALRLVTKCVETAGVDIQLKMKLLKVLAYDFTINNNIAAFHWDNNYFEGIKSGQVASAVARLIAQLPWWQACFHARNLFSPMRARKQLDSLAQLVISLVDLNCLEAADDLSNEITDIMIGTDWKASQQFEPSALVTCVGMYFKLLEFTNFGGSKSKSFVICGIKLPTLFPVIQGIEERYSEVLERSEACRGLVNDLRFVMAGCEIPLHSKDLAVRVFLYFYRLDNFVLLKMFVDTLINTDQDDALDVIVSSPEIWNECLAGAAGRFVLCSMVEHRIYQMESVQQPVFSWIQYCRPNDVDIIVHQFIRSPLKFKTFFFKDKTQENVQLWIDEQFGRPEDMALRGFSVVTVMEQIGNHFSVTVTKTPEVFRIRMEKFLNVRRNLMALRDRYHRRLKPLQNVISSSGKKLRPIKRPLIQ